MFVANKIGHIVNISLCVFGRAGWQVACLLPQICSLDNTLTVMPDITTAADFLNTLNHAHPAVSLQKKREPINSVLPLLDFIKLTRAARLS